MTHRERGRGADKRAWAIKQNEARETYLNHYYGMDVADHMIKNTVSKYITLKYWHSAYLHVQSMVVVAAFDMYKECCEGLLDSTWKINEKERMSYSEFFMKLSKQILKYDTRNNQYNENNKLCLFTQNHKTRRPIKYAMDTCEQLGKSFAESGLTIDNFRKGMMFPRLQCWLASDFGNHLASIVITTNGLPCEVCGKKCLTKCQLCNKCMCTMDKRRWNGAKCAVLFHGEEFFGLARSDIKAVHGKDVSGYRAPDKGTIARNVLCIRCFVMEINDNETRNNSDE